MNKSLFMSDRMFILPFGMSQINWYTTFKYTKQERKTFSHFVCLFGFLEMKWYLRQKENTHIHTFLPPFHWRVRSHSIVDEFMIFTFQFRQFCFALIHQFRLKNLNIFFQRITKMPTKAHNFVSNEYIWTKKKIAARSQGVFYEVSVYKSKTKSWVKLLSDFIKPVPLKWKFIWFFS